MAGGSGKGGKGGIGFEDFQLWKAFTRDIEPMGEEPDWAAIEATFQAAIPKKPAGETISTPAAPPKPSVRATAPPQPPQLDGNTELRLRRGKMPIEGTLDLHGYNQAQAHGRLSDFIMSAHGRGKRCLLVITGKGGRDKGDGPTEGVLRQKLPQWLALPPINTVILKTMGAAPHHGGSGAFYLYLKRQREPGS